MFGTGAEGEREIDASVEFPLHGSTTAGDLADFYGIDLGVPPDCTLSALLTRRLGPAPRPGAALDVAGVRLTVRHTEAAQVDQVGLSILPPDPDPPPSA